MSGIQRTITVTSRRPLRWASASDLVHRHGATLHGMQGVGVMIGLVLSDQPILFLVREDGAPKVYCPPARCRSVDPTRRISFGDFLRWSKP
jgi:hypothetical protein